MISTAGILATFDSNIAWPALTAILALDQQIEEVRTLDGITMKGKWEQAALRPHTMSVLGWCTTNNLIWARILATLDNNMAYIDSRTDSRSAD